MIKRLISALLALALLPAMSLVAAAHDVPQERSDCSIEVQVRYDGENVSGGTLCAIRVGYVDEDDGNYFFSRVGDDLPLEQIGTAEAAKELLAYYEANREQYTFASQTVRVAEGVARFENLETGLYLIIQETAAPGFTKLSPFLVSVPYLEEGRYVYDVTAAIKSELERETETEPTEPPTEPPEGDLPQTGQLNWPVPLMAVLGLGMITLGCVLRCRKKEGYET